MKWLMTIVLKRVSYSKNDNLPIHFVFQKMLINFAHPNWEELILIIQEKYIGQ